MTATLRVVVPAVTSIPRVVATAVMPVPRIVMAVARVAATVMAGAGLCRRDPDNQRSSQAGKGDATADAKRTRRAVHLCLSRDVVRRVGRGRSRKRLVAPITV